MLIELCASNYATSNGLVNLVFDPTNVKKHKLTYIILFHIQMKENLYLLIPFQHQNFCVDPRVHIKVQTLKTIAT
jgi:hypothetical protein